MDKVLLKQARLLAKRGYQIKVEREDGHEGAPIWVAYVSEMPSCIAQGDSAESAKDLLKTVKEDYIYFRLKRGVAVPNPKPASHDTTIRIEAYSRAQNNPSTKRTGAVGNRLASAAASYGQTRQPDAAFVSHAMKPRAD